MSLPHSCPETVPRRFPTAPQASDQASGTSEWMKALMDYVALAKRHASVDHQFWVKDMGDALVAGAGEGYLDIQALREFLYRTQAALSFDALCEAAPLLNVLNRRPVA